MHKEIQNLLNNNRDWAQRMCREDGDYFTRLSLQQNPDYLWIGCSDSRVPANQIIALPPGEVFVHRNVANLLYHTDMNALSVVQYAVDVLKVRHIMVVGHYGCGGVRASMRDDQLGLIDGWLRTIRDLYYEHRDYISTFPTEEEQVDRMCELNVIQQVANVSHTTIVQNAWHRGQPLAIHGCIYGIKDGVWKNLDVTISGPEQVPPQYRLRPRRNI